MSCIVLTVKRERERNKHLNGHRQPAQQSTIIIQSGVNSKDGQKSPQHRPLGCRATKGLSVNEEERAGPLFQSVNIRPPLCQKEHQKVDQDLSVTSDLSFEMLGPGHKALPCFHLWCTPASRHSAHFTEMFSLYIYTFLLLTRLWGPQAEATITHPYTLRHLIQCWTQQVCSVCFLSGIG